MFFFCIIDCWALRAHLLFQLLIVTLSVSSEHLRFVQYKTTTKKFADLIVFFGDFYFQNFTNFLKKFFLTFFIQIHKPSLGHVKGPTKNLSPIGSAVLTFNGYKQKDKKSIYRLS